MSVKRIFMSHSSKDNDICTTPLVKALSAVQGLEVWCDFNNLVIGSSLTSSISTSLDQADIFVVIHSKSYADSKWCLAEMNSIMHECISKNKVPFIIKLDDTGLPSLLKDFLNFRFDSANRDASISLVTDKLKALHGDLVRAMQGDLTDRAAPTSIREVSGMIIRNAGNNGRLTVLKPAVEDGQMVVPKQEGLILIKPGGTFYEPFLHEVFDRLSKYCRFKQIDAITGNVVKSHGLFRKLYSKQYDYASGKLQLSKSDLKAIQEIYDNDEFRAKFGTPYSDDLVVPALRLVGGPDGITAEEITEAWEEGRANGFQNKRYDGLNKIGYMKSVYPALLKGKLRIMVNGYIPGLEKLFIDPGNVIIAIHATTTHPWSYIRRVLVGNDANPKRCVPGSIRKDALIGKIPLEPKYLRDFGDRSVDGQRNVIHCSTTHLDGMIELCGFFDYSPSETVLGKVFEFHRIDPNSVIEILEEDRSTLPELSSKLRNDSMLGVVYESIVRRVHQDVVGNDARLKEIVKRKIAIYSGERKILNHVWNSNRQLKRFEWGGLRLSLGGTDFYLFHISKRLHSFTNATKSDLQHIFNCVAKEMDALMPADDDMHFAAKAEAFMIAASDLLLSQSKAWCAVARKHVLSLHQFYSELPMAAWKCGQRMEKNLYSDLHSDPVDPPMNVTIGDTVEWNDFTRSDVPVNEIRTKTVGIILSGGRSTRMRSSLPKPLFPFGETILYNYAENQLMNALGNEITIYAAVGYRKELVKKVLGPERRYLESQYTLGLGFRVAASLHSLQSFSGLIVISYCDMPLIKPESIRALISSTSNWDKKFGLLTSANKSLSGCVRRENGRICEIIQGRLSPERVKDTMLQDVGIYFFKNSPEIRSAIVQIKNNNHRSEFIFADIVEIISKKKDWEIIDKEIDGRDARGVNTPAEWVEAYRALKADDYEEALSKEYGISESISGGTAVSDYPVHFWDWEENWN